MEWKLPICAETRKGRNFSNLKRKKKKDVKRLGVTVGFQQQCLGQFLSQSNQFCPALGETQIAKKHESTASGAGIHWKKPGYGDGRLLPCTQTQLYLWRRKRGTKAAVAHLFASALVTCNYPLPPPGPATLFPPFPGTLTTIERGDKFPPWARAERWPLCSKDHCWLGAALLCHHHSVKML